MDWNTAPSALISKVWGYLPLGSSGSGGRLSIRINPFANPGGSLEVGVFSNPQGSDRTLVSAPQKALLTPFARILYFDLPPGIEGLALGYHLASEADGRSLPLALSWRIDAIAVTSGGGTITIPPPQGLVIAATLEQVVASVDARRALQLDALEATVLEFFDSDFDFAKHFEDQLNDFAIAN